MKKVSYSAASDQEALFKQAILIEVNKYFGPKSKFGNKEMYIKAYVLLALFIIPFVILLTCKVEGPLILIFITLLALIGHLGLPLGIMHDAAHGSFSKKKWVNTLMTNLVACLLGISSVIWKVQHTAHHAYTNIHEEDGDIGGAGILRFSESAKLNRFHRFQHLYAWGLYALFGFVRFFGEPARLIRYKKDNKLKSSFIIELTKLISIKLAYLYISLVLPIMATSYLWWEIAIAWTCLHVISGFCLAVTFQLAHLVEHCQQPKINPETREIKTGFFLHTLITTADFHIPSWLRWLIGGLNYQVVHHLFTHICHVHYSQLQVIVKKTAHDFGYQYNHYTSLWKAMVSHTRRLKELGQSA